MRRETLVALTVVLWVSPIGATELERSTAENALRRAVEYYSMQVSVEGGYLYTYSEDLSQREGEHKATATMAWVQPPGTPAVGLALLAAFEATGDTYYLDCARQTADALLRGQLLSGGWTYSIEFDPEKRRGIAYRVPPSNPDGHNLSVLDDNNSQAAMRFLMRMDKTLKFEESSIHEAVLYALDHLVAAQYPNGAWPQRFEAPPKAEDFPVRQASYPTEWSRRFPKAKYTGYYTFNDNAMGDCVEVLFEAARLYEQPKYRDSAARCGDFLLLAQMPEPQPAWAQQYDAEMHPAWPRKFEPPSVTGGESQSNLQSLLLIYRETGDRKYLEPVERAMAYLEASKLPDGQLARFYELKTNKPLYFTRDYQLTYSDADMPTHYSFKLSAARLARVRYDYEKLKNATPESLRKPAKPRKPGPPSAETIARATQAVEMLDDRGRWLELGRLKEHDPLGPDQRVLRTTTFIVNIKALSDYLAAKE